MLAVFFTCAERQRGASEIVAFEYPRRLRRRLGRIPLANGRVSRAAVEESRGLAVDSTRYGLRVPGAGETISEAARLVDNVVKTYTLRCNAGGGWRD